MEDKKVMSHLLKGLIIGLILIVISVVVQFTGMKRDSLPVQLFSIAVLVGGVIWSCWYYGKQKDGFVTFGNVFAHGFKTTAVMAVIVIIFLIIFFIAFPELKEEALEEGRRQAEESGRQTDEQIEEGMKIAKRLFLPILAGSILFFYLILGAIASLIGAAITKKKPFTPFDQIGKLMDLSLVIPLKDEEESLPELAEWISRVMIANNYSYEIIFVDDGSTDNSWKIIEELSNRNPNVKGIKFQRNYGKSAGLNEGFRAAEGDVVITMDADLQDSPDEIPELRRMIVEGGFDLVSGWKKIRYDNTFTKNIPSKFYNAMTRKMSGIKLHDFNCGLKAYKKKVVKGIEVYGEMHRYIPVIAKWSGYKKIGEKVVEHRKRKYGVTKFGLSRFINGPLDLISISFVGRFSKRPMHFFGLWGSIFFLIGIGLSLFLIIRKFIEPESTLTDKPGFYIALATTIIGVQLFLAGFLGELISRNAPGRNSYLIEKKLGV